MKEDLRKFIVFLDQQNWLDEFQKDLFGPVMIGSIRLKLAILFSRYKSQNPNVRFPEGAKIGCSFEHDKTTKNLRVEIFMTVPMGLFQQKVKVSDG